MNFDLNWKILGAAAAVGLVGAPSHAQWVTPTTAGTPILATINPKVSITPTPALCAETGLPPSGDQVPVQQQSASLATGKFGGLPGSAAMPGYASLQIASASYVLQTGSPATTVGMLYDRVYCAGSGTSTCNGTNVYVFATRAILNTAVITPPNWTFGSTDFFRTVPSTATVDVGYYMGTSGTGVDNGLAFKYLEYAGRTNAGLGQVITRDNTKIAFRIDTNASDPDRCEPYSKSSAISPWVYHRMTCPNGVETAAANITFKTRIRNGTRIITTSGFVCRP